MNQWFTSKLLKWHAQNPIEMPWKKNNDPYSTWLSEVILQQTRVAQGLPYYIKLYKAYPNVHALAAAPIDEVFKHWQGLGYYSRAQNMHATAKYIASHLNGQFPQSYSTLIKLKGIGPYTAAAIASFCYNEPVAVLDGNVYRVLSRIFGIETPIDSSAGKHEFTQLANELISKKFPGLFNQAIMNYGSSVCTPRNPICHACIFNNKCIAFYNQTVFKYPQKKNKLIAKVRNFQFVIFIYKNNNVIIEKRTNADIWKGLYQFPVFEGELAANKPLLENWLNTISKKWKIKTVSDIQKQTLTHQKLNCNFIICLGDSIHLNKLESNQQVIELNQLANYAFPRVIAQYLQNEFHDM